MGGAKSKQAINKMREYADQKIAGVYESIPESYRTHAVSKMVFKTREVLCLAVLPDNPQDFPLKDQENSPNQKVITEQESKTLREDIQSGAIP